MKPLNRIAMFAVVLSLAYISSPAQDKASPPKTEPKPRQVWITLKLGEILTGDLAQMDPVSVGFKVKGILQSVPCDDLIGVMFAPPTPTPTPTSDERVEWMTASLRPTILYREKAKYTDKARNNGIEGTVILQVVFRRYGSLTDIRVLRGLPHGLTENAIEAAKKIRFKPAMKDGRPISVRGALEFDFNLHDWPTVKLLSPDDGAVFSHYPRKVTLQWERYTEAKLYKVRIEQGYPNSSDWSFLQELEVAEPEYVFYFTGAKPGRWKVTVILKNGKEITSSWRTFRFTQ
jgi:TonB family protein